MLYLRAVLIVLALSGSSLTAGAAGQTDAGKTVDKLHEALLDVMKRSAELGYTGRYQTLDPVISQSFDFPGIARVVVGRHWSELSPEEQNTFVETFSRLSIATYASRFDNFSGESFHHVLEENQSGNNVIVKTELLKPDGSAVKLDYVLRQSKDNRWRILNVIADGISDLSLKRADYTSIIKNEGYAALIAKLNDRIVRYESAPRSTGN
ncbi:MAG: ABC transporter substrate-binding protein [Chromatiales bacterium]